MIQATSSQDNTTWVGLATTLLGIVTLVIHQVFRTRRAALIEKAKVESSRLEAVAVQEKKTQDAQGIYLSAIGTLIKDWEARVKTVEELADKRIAAAETRLEHERAVSERLLEAERKRLDLEETANQNLSKALEDEAERRRVAEEEALRCERRCVKLENGQRRLQEQVSRLEAQLAKTNAYIQQLEQRVSQIPPAST